ncbi:MAG: hypothetical protein ACR2QF_04915 [Geminicoccaceae bacterium]
MRWGIIVGLFMSLLAAEVSAGSVLIYDGRGNLDRVLRPSPSGFIVYDGLGNIVSAVRQTGFGNRVIIDPGLTGVRVIGTGLGTDLSSEASSLRGGVGFD